MNVLIKISVRVSLIRVEELYICLPATFLSRGGYSNEGRSTRLAKNFKKNLIERQKIAFSRNEVTRSRITEVEGKIRALSASWIVPIYTSPGKKVTARISEVTLSTSTSRSKKVQDYKLSARHCLFCCDRLPVGGISSIHSA